MAEFVFTSPGVKFKERDLTFVTRNVGITTLGLVGETIKGPAFEPVFVQDKTEYTQRFGGQSIKKFANGSLQYQLPYVANAYLDESNQLWVTRVLGLSGYDAGTAWAIVLDAGIDTTTIGSTTGSSITETFTNNSYLGVSLWVTGDTGSAFSGYTKITPTTFSGIQYNFIVVSITGSSGTVSVTPITKTGTSLTEYENMVLAVVRSRGIVEDNVNAPPVTKFETDSLTVTGNTTVIGIGDLFGEFTLIASNSASTETYTITLNPSASSFISNVVGFEPKDKKTKIWVQAVYPDLIKKLDSENLAYGVKSILIDCDSDIYTDYRTQFKTPETPWVVSQLKGNKIDRLFKFISISDGDAANKEIKISVTNVNPIAYEFDVVVRDFNDTDANPRVFETFTRCNLIEGTNGFVGQRIGTSDGKYNLQSKYIMIELANEIAPNVFPAGFEGYMLNNYDTSITGSIVNGIAPKILYKTKYEDNERFNRVYLGISNLAYSNTGNGINQNFFNFNGWMGVGVNNFSKTKGFHMDSGATGNYGEIGEFEVGVAKLRGISDVTDATLPYFNIQTRKFTLVPSGGFDGWDVHRLQRSHGDLYSQNGIYDGVDPNTTPFNDFQAWETAINTYANAEEVTINLFTTPGINWSDQNILVRNTIEMIETQRTDSLYVIDSPDIDIERVIGESRQDVVAAEDIVDSLENASIDSSYSCTYFPWIQIRDTQNNVNIYIPPTGEVVKAIAFTDNSKFPWFAPAGLQRGVTDAIKSKYKLSLEARDILYRGRINPIADFADSGTAIFGQKTLQIKETALDRINVRRLLLQIKVLISNIATRLVFEQNDQATIDQFLSKATPILDTIKRERGLQEFRIKMDDSINTPESLDRNELYGEIYLKPTRSLEFIGITFMITPSGASFSDVGA